MFGFRFGFHNSFIPGGPGPSTPSQGAMLESIYWQYTALYLPMTEDPAESEGNETRYDLGPNGLNAVGQNTVAAVSGGLFGGKRAKFVRASSESLLIQANSLLDFTGSFTLLGWFEHETLAPPANSQYYVNWSSSGIRMSQSGNQNRWLDWVVESDGTKPLYSKPSSEIPTGEQFLRIMTYDTEGLELRTYARGPSFDHSASRAVAGTGVTGISGNTVSIGSRAPSGFTECLDGYGGQVWFFNGVSFDSNDFDWWWNDGNGRTLQEVSGV